MLVMFLPLKILFSMSLISEGVAFDTVVIGKYFNVEVYAGDMLVMMALISLLSVVVKVVQGRLQIRIKKEVKLLSFGFVKGVIEGGQLTKLVGLYCTLLSEFMLVVFGVLVVLVLHWQIALVFFVLLSFQIQLCNWVVFSRKKGESDDFFGITAGKLNDVVFNVFFLSMFFIIIAWFIMSRFDIFYALLIMLIARIGMQSVKNFFVASVKFNGKIKYKV